MTISVETMQKSLLLVLAVLVIAAAGIFSLFIAWSVLAGGALVLANLWFSQKGVVQLVTAVTSADAEVNSAGQQAVAKNSQRWYLRKFWLRIVITGVVLAVLLRWRLVNIFGLVVGLSIIFITTTGFAFAMVVHYLIQQNQGRR
ncbi:MAG: hypothetical protein CSA81_14185 [Acidobacteria bacterium]|nr:MAG: hypothetical protein CSA81_14185 [Acidobacteriota bacterium]